MAEVNCEGRTIREINVAIKASLGKGDRNVRILNPTARHNIGVALLEPCQIEVEGSAGYFCAGLIDGANFVIKGSAGWGLAESMMNGEVIVRGSVGNGAAAAIRGGTVVIHGDAAARLGISMKGGTVLVAGNCGYMAGFMGQKGTMIVCGDTGDAFADSLYETVCFVGGNIAGLGTDAVVETPSAEEAASLEAVLSKYLSAEVRKTKPAVADFKKVVAGRKLWNFNKREWKLWQEAL